MASEYAAASSPDAEIEKRIERLFLRLSAIYGYIWWNMYRNDELLEITKLEWSTALKRFDNQVLKEALLSYRTKKGYPPTLPEFIDCCAAIQKRLDPCRIEYQSAQRGNEDIAKQHLKNMLEHLKK
jgi:hypothetical protein